PRPDGRLVRLPAQRPPAQLQAVRRLPADRRAAPGRQPAGAERPPDQLLRRVPGRWPGPGCPAVRRGLVLLRRGHQRPGLVRGRPASARYVRPRAVGEDRGPAPGLRAALGGGPVVRPGRQQRVQPRGLLPGPRRLGHRRRRPGLQLQVPDRVRGPAHGDLLGPVRVLTAPGQWREGAPRGALFLWRGGRRTQRPSSNTTSSDTETLLSPGATGVLSNASAFIAPIRGIGTGMPAPPSPMLTIRRTRRPSALA